MSNFEYSLVNHFIHDLILLGMHPSNLKPYQHALFRDWLPVAIGDPGMLMGMFLCACRDLYLRTGLKEYYWGTLQYKGKCLRYLSGSIATAPKMAQDRAESNVWDVIICTMLQLASDDLAAGDSAAWKSHIDAVAHMVKLNGGLENVRGMDGLLRRMIEVLASKDCLQVRNITSNGDNTAKLYTLDDIFGKCLFG
ncbi:hypothetical protein DL768_001932 [Monosporascus sp. mg162]|nr:hypothetical protein DL768_001932 [Monosporascus sp. mg162]